jgi:hypothetical protein
MFEISPLPLRMKYLNKPGQLWLLQDNIWDWGGEKSQILSCNNQSCPGLFKYFIGRGRGEISNIDVWDFSPPPSYEVLKQTWTALVVTGQCLRFLPSPFLWST